MGEKGKRWGKVKNNPMTQTIAQKSEATAPFPRFFLFVLVLITQIMDELPGD